MTRQIFILIIAISVVVFGGILETNYLKNSCNFVLSDINYTENAIKNNKMEIARQHVEEIENSWNNVKDAWHIFVQSDLINQIDDSLVALKSYINVEDKNESLISIARLKSNILSIVDRQEVNMQNIF